MSDEFRQTDEGQVSEPRRRFVKAAGATGAAALGAGTFGGSAAAQDQVFGDVDATIVNGLVNVVVQDINVEDVEILRIRIQNVRELVTVEDVTVDVDIDVSDVNVQALNNAQIVVQALSPDGRVIQTATTRAQ